MSGTRSRGALTAAAAKLFNGADRLLTAIETALMAMIVVVMLGVMVLVAVDGLGRYLFNRPLYFTVDLVSHYLLPILMILPASLVLRRAGHISVDPVATLLPKRLYQALIGLALLATAVVVAIMTWRVLLASTESYTRGKVALGLIPWPLWAEQAIYVFCLGLLAARMLHVAATNLVAGLSGDPEIGISMLNPHDSPQEEAV